MHTTDITIKLKTSAVFFTAVSTAAAIATAVLPFIIN